MSLALNEPKRVALQPNSNTIYKSSSQGDNKWKSIIDFVRETSHGKKEKEKKRDIYIGNQLPMKSFVEFKDTTNNP